MSTLSITNHYVKSGFSSYQSNLCAARCRPASILMILSEMVTFAEGSGLFHNITCYHVI